VDLRSRSEPDKISPSTWGSKSQPISSKLVHVPTKLFQLPVVSVGYNILSKLTVSDKMIFANYNKDAMQCIQSKMSSMKPRYKQKL